MNTSISKRASAIDFSATQLRLILERIRLTASGPDRDRYLGFRVRAGDDGPAVALEFRAGMVATKLQ